MCAIELKLFNPMKPGPLVLLTLLAVLHLTGAVASENSIGGFVGETHKLLLSPQDPGWHVIAEVTLSISNNLLVKPGTRPSDLRKIISHPEALRESANWLKANFPQLPQEGVNSTASQSTHCEA